MTLPFWPARSRSCLSVRIASTASSSSSASRSALRGGRGRREELLLVLRREVDARRELEIEERRVCIGDVDVAVGLAGEGGEELEDRARGRPRSRRRPGPARRSPSRRSGRSSLGDDAKSRASLDDDVQTAVLEALDVRDAGPCPDVAEAAVVREDEAEVLLVVEAVVDELEVPRLEDVERDALGREQDDRQREQAELGHPGSVRVADGRTRRFPAGPADRRSIVAKP